MKIDYNETIGIGCDGAESPGEGLRKNMEASVSFLKNKRRGSGNCIGKLCVRRTPAGAETDVCYEYGFLF